MYRKPTTRDVKQHEWHLGSSLWMTEPRQVFFWLSCNSCYGYEIVVKSSNQTSIFGKLFTDCHLSVAASCTSTPFPPLLYIRGLHNPYGSRWKVFFHRIFLGQNIPFRPCGCRKWQPQTETPFSKLQDSIRCSSSLLSWWLYVISSAFQITFIAIKDSDSSLEQILFRVSLPKVSLRLTPSYKPS